jgi:hypothetical protein
MNITNILAIGNGEKCPFCDLIITEDTDTLVHMTESHKEELNKALFGGDNDKS